MQNFKKIAKTGLKVAMISTISISTLSYGYLQYINSILGPINIQYDEAISYYKDKHKMTDSEAVKTYYFAVWNLSLTRIINYRNYTWYCDKLNRKIVDFTLGNYDQEQILQLIDQAGSVKENKAGHQKIYKKIEEIRKKNNQNIEDRQFLIKSIFDYQKQMNSCEIPEISEEKKQKISKIHQYIIEVGSSFKDPEILKKLQRLSQYEKKFPKDFIHKVLLI